MSAAQKRVKETGTGLVGSLLQLQVGLVPLVRRKTSSGMVLAFGPRWLTASKAFQLSKKIRSSSSMPVIGISSRRRTRLLKVSSLFRTVSFWVEDGASVTRMLRQTSKAFFNAYARREKFGIRQDVTQ